MLKDKRFTTLFLENAKERIKNATIQQFETSDLKPVITMPNYLPGFKPDHSMHKENALTCFELYRCSL